MIELSLPISSPDCSGDFFIAKNIFPGNRNG